jgi:hypothetical protein
VALPRTSWRRRPLLVLIILIVLLVIGYAVRAADGRSGAGSQPTGPQLMGTHRVISAVGLAQTAQDGGRLAAKAAMPSCACGPAK